MSYASRSWGLERFSMHHYAIDDFKKGWAKVMPRIGFPPGPAL
jgi:hypothetical protein